MAKFTGIAHLPHRPGPEGLPCRLRTCPRKVGMPSRSNCSRSCAADRFHPGIIVIKTL
jgi:hypothetical protein